MARKTKKELDTAKELAYILFMSSVPQIEIAERVGVSAVSINKWVKDGEWEAKRGAKTVTRTELINRVLEKINALLEAEDGEINADKLAKLSVLIERLDKKNSPVMVMDVFIAFSGYLQQQAMGDKTITMDFIKQLNKHQDAYISTKLTE